MVIKILIILKKRVGVISNIGFVVISKVQQILLRSYSQQEGQASPNDHTPQKKQSMSLFVSGETQQPFQSSSDGGMSAAGMSCLFAMLFDAGDSGIPDEVTLSSGIVGAATTNPATTARSRMDRRCMLAR